MVHGGDAQPREAVTMRLASGVHAVHPAAEGGSPRIAPKCARIPAATMVGRAKRAAGPKVGNSVPMLGNGGELPACGYQRTRFPGPRRCPIQVDSDTMDWVHFPGPPDENEATITTCAAGECEG